MGSVLIGPDFRQASRDRFVRSCRKEQEDILAVYRADPSYHIRDKATLEDAAPTLYKLENLQRRYDSEYSVKRPKDQANIRSLMAGVIIWGRRREILNWLDFYEMEGKPGAESAISGRPLRIVRGRLDHDGPLTGGAWNRALLDGLHPLFAKCALRQSGELYDRVRSRNVAWNGPREISVP